MSFAFVKDVLHTKTLLSLMVASQLSEASLKKTITPSTESHLLERLKASDNQAFREFVRLYQRRLYTLAFQLLGNREDAEDLVQETFIKAHGALPQFQGTSSLYTWLHRIAVNLYIDYTRSGRYRAIQQWDQVRDENTDKAQWHTPQPTPEASFQAVLQQEHIEQALHKLTTQQRAVFVLRHYQDLSLEEVAEELHVTVGTVKTLLFRAVRELREHLAMYR